MARVSETPGRRRDSVRSAVPTGRLAGKVAVITGAAGNIGEHICRRYLDEGATIVMVGRDRGKLDAARQKLIDEASLDPSRVSVVAFDAADPSQARAGIQQTVALHRRLDIVVNNAGSAGPKQRLADLPFLPSELEALRAGGASDSETVQQAARNLLGVSWNMVRAASPHLQPGASVINISTIFSRTQYYGRAAYVVPKAALNAFSRQLAGQLGARGIRVNTVFPGPIESERIRSVFASMDKLRAETPGTTASEFFELMTLARARNGEPPARIFPTVRDVADTIVFLGSDESSAINGHNFEITHGMLVRRESRSTFVSRPGLRIVDASGQTVLVAGGDQSDEALAIARLQSDCGAEVLLGLGDPEALRSVSAALGDSPRDRRIRCLLFDRTAPASLGTTLGELRGRCQRLHTAIVLPAFGPHRFAGPFADMADADAMAFIDAELCGVMAIARALTRFWKDCSELSAAPRVVFVSNGDDGAGNHYADMLRAATEELIRIWRDETEVEQRAGKRRWVEWSNQVIRWTNDEYEGLRFAGGWAAKLLYTQRHIRQVNLYLPTSIVEATGARRATFGSAESLMGVHLGKVALVTGGSAGIGGQIARLLAIAGARVMLVARGREQLQTMRDAIVEELEAIGYDGAANRVAMIADVDVSDQGGLGRAADATLERFGRIDYLINNAGVAGAEEMVVDMPLESWRATLTANLISNFTLMHRVVPMMKRTGGGYILNVSSYFGGEKYVAVAYPNRADYAVSKAGQRALVENLARFVGPEIQLNAIAPGPVDGDRLRGKDGKPGLFERRGHLILENRRLNALYAAVIESARSGAATPGRLLDMIARNDVRGAATSDESPPTLRRLAERLAAQQDSVPGASAYRFLLDRSIAAKLTERLRTGGLLLREPDRGARFDDRWLDGISAPPAPFFAAAEVTHEAEKIRSGVLKLLHLKNMPTEMEVALATVYFLADRAVSGETFQPSGGLHQERSITERELFGRAKAERLEAMRGRTVWLIGEHLEEQLAKVAEAFLVQCRVSRVVLLMRSASTAAAITERLARISAAGRVHTLVVENDIEKGMDVALETEGPPAAVISTPFSPLPTAVLGAGAGVSMDPDGFVELIEDNITHHFRVAKKVSLMDDVRLVIVSPDAPLGPTLAEFALANFVKTTLHALTATLAVENERLVHEVPVNQVNLTRRVRSEEPRNSAETAEELERFARAVLLASAPLPDQEDSRYRSRIYRGMAITV